MKSRSSMRHASCAWRPHHTQPACGATPEMHRVDRKTVGRTLLMGISAPDYPMHGFVVGGK